MLFQGSPKKTSKVVIIVIKSLSKFYGMLLKYINCVRGHSEYVTIVINLLCSLCTFYGNFKREREGLYNKTLRGCNYSQ